MRPQQNRRMRGRGGNNNQGRKGPNPLTRSYESNGPDVKIRGSAQQIAEKYTTLARDAQSSGDRVMAENYLQHAEHYNRIIMAAQAQLQQQQQFRDSRDDDDADDESEEFVNEAPREQQPRQDQQPREQQPREQQPRQERHNRANGSGPQPVIDGVPAEVALKQGSMSDTQSTGASDGGEAETSAAEPEQAEASAPARRPRRPRRPRVKDGDQQASSDEQQGSGEEPVTEAAQ